ncbi:MAG: gliding motility-associated C-terminal domain-containing protein [Prevotella sp.]|nr:gliding motility-associated C-terminal domain-containing protein [Prevotella sp.]
MNKMTQKHLFLLLAFLCFPLFVSAQTDETTDETETDPTEEQSDSIVVSHIEIYNAFSPNGDGKNDVLTVKTGKTVGIVEFRAIIFNRWGQKLYEWTDLNGGWDGTVNGRPAKQGTYFVLVKAKGSDGQTHTIRRDVNLLRGYTEGYSNNEQ